MDLAIAPIDPQDGRALREWFEVEQLSIDHELVGVGEVQLSRRDNLHLAQLALHVRPDRRRRGVGRALHEEKHPVLPLPVAENEEVLHGMQRQDPA